jgi:DnaK suppressor protein
MPASALPSVIKEADKFACARAWPGPTAGQANIVCRNRPLYKRRARGTIPSRGAARERRLQAKDGLALEKLKNYRPTEKEPFMNERQREYFRVKLLTWKDEILRESKITLQTLQEENVNHPDLADRASSETDRAIELRARDRQRKLISKIDAALQRIEDNTYGYCEETGEPISLKRLEARPIATLSVEAQERHEKREKVYRDE